jgi:hypothetical protein
MANRMRASANPRAARFVLGILGIGGIAILMIAALFTVRTLSFLRHSAGAVGMIERLEPEVRQSSNGRPHTTYAPVFSFVTAEGREVLVTSRMSSNPPGFHPGESVPVLYDPRNPLNARINTFGQMWGAETILGGLGAAFCGMNLAWLVSIRRGIRRTSLTAVPPA